MKPQVLDLSHHNTLISLQGAKDEGIVGIIHKLTDGTGFIDSKASTRYKLVQDTGLLWGVYHFLRPGQIKRQVDFFLSTAAHLMDDNTLLCCDYEVADIPLTDVLRFLQAVENQTMHSPVLYGGSILKEAGGAGKVKELANYRLWLAQYGQLAVLPKGYKKYWLWQYSQTGQINGISGSVDLDYFDGTTEELTAQWSGKSSEGQPADIASVVESPQATPKDVKINAPTGNDPPITQTADMIVNASDIAPPKFVPENKTMDAPVKDGATSATAKVTIAGIVIPPIIVSIIKAVQDLVSQGYIDSKQVGDTVLKLIIDNQKYVFMLIVAIIGLLIVKKLAHLVVYLFEMYINARPDWHNIQIVPASTQNTSWWHFWNSK